MRAVGGLLPRALRRTAGRGQVLASVVLQAASEACRTILPAGVARRVRPVSFRDGTVVVRAESAVVGSEVRMRSTEVLTTTTHTLRRRGFRIPVSELRVRVGS